MALLLSLPLVTYLVLEPLAAIVGMVVFQMTMPVTLKAVHHLMPERPGLAFGLPCVALIVGALPGVAGYHLFVWLASTGFRRGGSSRPCCSSRSLCSHACPVVSEVWSRWALPPIAPQPSPWPSFALSCSLAP